MSADIIFEKNAAPLRRHTTLADAWRPPLPPDPRKRTISRKSRGSGRAIITGGATPHQNPCESLLEYKGGIVTLAHPQVVDLQYQEPTVAYRDEDGKLKRHIFDFTATLRDSRRIAIAIRPECRAAPVREIVKLIAAQVRGVADGYLVLTDRHLTRDIVHNAEMVLFARDGDPAADAKIRAIVARIHGAIAIGDLSKLSGFEGEGFRAVCRLIGAGEIEIPKGARISEKTLVAKAGGLA